MIHRYIFTILVLMFVSVSTLAYAQQEADKEQDQDKQDYYVVVEDRNPEVPTISETATKLPVSLQLAPASIGVVTESLFKNQYAINLSDALRNISGINVQTGFNTFDFFTIRGFDSLSSALVLIDGAPEPESTFYKLYNVERVEVFKGPGAFLYGGNPLSGTVNLVRKQPELRNMLGVSTSYGSFGTQQGNVDVNLGDTGRDIAFRVNGFWSVSDQYRDDKDHRDIAINPAFSWRINDESLFRANVEYLTNSYEPDSGIPVIGNRIADVPRERSYQSPFDDSDQHIFRVRLDYETQVNANLLIRNKFYSSNLDWETNGTLFSGIIPDPRDLLIVRTMTVLDDTQRLTGNQLEAVMEFESGNIKHELLAGFEISQLTDDFTLDVALLPPIGVANPVETAREPLFVIPGQSLAGDARSLILAPYVADHLSFSNRFHIYAGARFDHLDYDEELNSTERNESQVSPMFGALYAPRQDVSIYFNAARAFAPPSTLVVGEREPERSTQFEAGVKKQFDGGKWVTSFAAYRLTRDNIAIPDDTGITRQIGDQLSKGFEAELIAAPDPHWTTFLTYAFNDSELTRFSEFAFDGQRFVPVDRSGNTPPFAPRHILNLWTMKMFENGKWGIGGGPRYVSSQFISEDNRFAIDSYLTFDAVVLYRLQQNWRLTLNFKNLTDREYETRGFGPFSVIPADPFAVYAGVDFSL